MISKNQLDEFDDFVSQFSKENHRSAIILSAAKLDQQLYLLLSKYLRPLYSKSLGSPFEADGPLASFHAKINLCYMLGLIDMEFAKTLHLVRKIRNDFAHQTGVHLDEPKQRSKVLEIVRTLKRTPFFEDVRKVYFPDKTNGISEFYIALTALAVRIEAITISICSIPIENEAMIQPPIYEQIASNEGI